MNEPTRLPINADAANDICQRITGRTPAEWDALYQRRRYKHMTERVGGFRRLNGSKVYTTSEMMDACRFYGFSGDEFERVIGKCRDEPVDVPHDMAGMPVVVLEPAMAERESVRHASAARVVCAPLKAIVGWRLTQAALREIHAAGLPD